MRLRRDPLDARVEPVLDAEQRPELGGEQHGLHGAPKAGIFEKNVAKPYEHSYRSNALDKIQRHSTVQLAPSRPNGKKVFEQRKEEWAERRAQLLAASSGGGSSGTATAISASSPRGPTGKPLTALEKRRLAEEASRALEGAAKPWEPVKPPKWSATLLPSNSRTSERANLPHCTSVASFHEMQRRWIDPNGSEGFDFTRLHLEGGHKIRDVKVSHASPHLMDPEKSRAQELM